MRKFAILVGVCCVTATACSDRPPESPVTAPSFDLTTASTCPSPSTLNDLIRAVFPSGGDRSSALSRFRQVVRLTGPTNPGPDTASAQAHALSLIDFILQKYYAGRLIGGQSAATQATLNVLLDGMLCTVGLPPAFGSGVLGPDGAVAFIRPTTPDTTVVTQTEWAGVTVPAASVTQPSLVTIRRLPDSPWPLLTPFDQYPLFYEYDVIPASQFAQFVIVGVCQASNVTPPDPSRLRLAHNVGNSAVIIPLAPAPFLDCTDAPIASGPSRWGFDLARARGLLERGIASLLLPAPAYAFGTSGVGGTVRTFSPFGAVDTLGIVSPAVITESHAPTPGSITLPTPSVYVKTPTGRPMAGIPVAFAVTVGGGSVTGGSTVTDVNGQATVGSWTLGTIQRRNELLVTPTGPAGTGFTSTGFEIPFTFLGFPRIF